MEINDYINADRARRMWAPEFGITREDWFITDDGRVWDMTNRRWVAENRDEDGRNRVYYNKKFLMNVARVMLFIFKPQEYFNGAWALHEDDIPSHDVLTNLYWGTPANNAEDRLLNGYEGWTDEQKQKISISHKKSPKIRRGEAHARSVLTDEEVRTIYLRVHKDGEDFNAVVRELGLSRDTLYAIVIHKRSRRGLTEQIDREFGFSLEPVQLGKVTEEIIREIYLRVNRDGQTAYRAGKDLGVCWHTANGIAAGKTHRHITEKLDVEFGLTTAVIK